MSEYYCRSCNEVIDIIPDPTSEEPEKCECGEDLEEVTEEDLEYSREQEIRESHLARLPA